MADSSETKPLIENGDKNSKVAEADRSPSKQVQKGVAAATGNEKSSTGSSPSVGGATAASLVHRKVNHVHKLERKHSSGDLHSRLKTRKLLGVGETDDGDVHRSKLSQILGHSEQLYTRLPRGLRVWQVLLALMFSVISLWALMFPKSLYKFALHEEGDDVIVLPIRLYGAALLSFSIVFWSTLQAVDKDVIRWSLLASTIYFLAQIIVTSMTLYELGLLMEKGASVLCHRILFALVSGYYYYCLNDHKIYRSRRSNSTQELNTSGTK